MLFFRNHFGMVVSLIIALILSLLMATAAIFWNSLDFSIELWIKNWGSAFLTIMFVTLILPVKIWGDKLAGLCRLKPRTLPFGLVSNIVPTLFYNTAATMVLVGVNVTFTAPFYWAAVAHDWLFFFCFSYIVSLIAEAFAVKVALKNVPIAGEDKH